MTSQNPAGPPSGAIPAPASPSSPFAAITIRDYAMDVCALILTIASLFMVFAQWQDRPQQIAAEALAILLTTILSILSLALTYLWRAGVFGPAWSYTKMQDLRLLANIPYVIAFLVYLAMVLFQSGYMGPGAVVGLAGVLLAMAPRQSEMGVQVTDQARDQRWLVAIFGLAGLGILVFLIQLIKFLMDLAYWDWTMVVTRIISGAVCAVVPLIFALKIKQGSETVRLAALGLALTGLLVLIITMAQDSYNGAGLSGIAPEMNFFFVITLGALAAAAPVRRAMNPVAGIDLWRGVLNLTLVLAIGAAVLQFVWAVLQLISVNSENAYYMGSKGAVLGVIITFLIFSLFQGVGAFVLRKVLAQQPEQTMKLASGYAIVMFVLMLIPLVIGANNSYTVFDMLLFVSAFAVPIAILGLIWIPRSMREKAGAASVMTGGPKGFSFDGSGGATPPMPQQAAARVSPLEQAQSDVTNPRVSTQRLQEIAANFPTLRKAVVENPAVYPELVEWIHQVEPSLTQSPVAEETAVEVHETAATADSAAERSIVEPKEELKPESEATTPVAQAPKDSEVAQEKVAEAPETKADEAPDLEADAPAVDAPKGNYMTNPADAEAHNPQTEGARLAELAGSDSSLHQAIYSNPSAYPSLKKWIEAVSPSVYLSQSQIDGLQAELSDPGTTAARLQEISAEHHFLHAAIVGHPAVYEGLLSWIEGNNAPGVAEALKNR
ncbi:DUF7937 domain-containing protein [Glutamicibacter ardleyensis]|uniref:DUF7937 domain-containing protein n=1 Tax=Glutamicibacter ardleyensis TaxID=225894 RepID=UPI003FD18822